MRHGDDDVVVTTASDPTVLELGDSLAEKRAGAPRRWRSHVSPIKNITPNSLPEMNRGDEARTNPLRAPGGVVQRDIQVDQKFMS